MDKFDYQALVNEVVFRNINMFDNFDNWTKGAFALSTLGEDGRPMFKSISKLSCKYNEAENNRKFSNALHTGKTVGLASFIYMCREYGIDTNRFYVKDGVECAQPVANIATPKTKKESYVNIPYEYVKRSLDRYCCSDFVSFLKRVVANDDAIVEIVNTYHLGITRAGHIIYWYVDEGNIVRMGKMMSYNSDGRRDKSSTPLSIPKELANRGKLPTHYVLRKTLFGEHLLRNPQNANKTICIVESEKTAVVCSLCFKSVLWMATGSKGNLQDERLSAVKNSKVLLFPDTDGDGQTYRQWWKRARELNAAGWNIQVSDYLELFATAEERMAKIDIADLILDDLAQHNNRHIEAIADMLQGKLCGS